jgi:hypothetical protein
VSRFALAPESRPYWTKVQLSVPCTPCYDSTETPGAAPSCSPFGGAIHGARSAGDMQIMADIMLSLTPEVGADIQDRINSCELFREGKCPHQSIMERVYLIPQILDPEELRRLERLCCACEQCAKSSES